MQLYFFFGEAASRDLTPIRTYADRVESMLEEFALASNGMLLVERIDPAPFSEAEDEAAAFGLQAVPVSATGDALYFGLAGSDALDNVETIPFFQPDREMFLEYEISQLIDRLARPQEGSGRADQYLAGYESGESADFSTRAWLAVDPVTRRHSDLGIHRCLRRGNSRGPRRFGVDPSEIAI